jgi:hypothetical protein
MTLENKRSEQLASIGLPQDSRAFNVLRIIMQLIEENKEPVTTKQIHDAIKKAETQADVSKTWIHKVIKSLVEMKLVRLESEHTYQKRYTTDLGTIVSGLEFLKSQTIGELETGQEELSLKLKQVNDCECQEIAEGLFESVTGAKQKMSSRFIRGLSEFFRVTNYSIYEIAKEGDVIRNCMLWVEPFITDDMQERLARLFTSAQKGVEVRYFVTEDFLASDSFLADRVDTSVLKQIMSNLVMIVKAGMKLDFRVYTGPKNTYQFASLNKERIAFFLTQDPLTAVYFTREFNSDLIENSISEFDKYWKKAPKFFDWLVDLSKENESGEFMKLVADIYEKGMSS